MASSPSRKVEEDEAADEPFYPITEETLSALTGVTPEAFGEVTELEAIFSQVHEIRLMEHMVNLRSMCMIDSGLRYISGLEPLGRTLVRLVLTEQRITRMEGLALPNLRDLQLHNNQISAIEGLQGCPQLQRLWLFGNRISVIENLEPVSGLRELWLQDNKVSRITGVKHLVNLQVLNLGANRVADLQDLHVLEKLPALRSLAFADVNFGECPVTELSGYRNYVVCNLPQLSQLDGDDISSRERKSATDAYMHKALKFAKRMADLVSENEQELLAIEARRQRNWLSSGAMRGELLATFGELETVVRDGRQAVSVEQARQQHVRESNLEALAEQLEVLRREQAAWVDARLAEERAAMDTEEAAFKALVQRAEAEAEEAAYMSALVYRTKGAVVCQELSEHSPDFRFLASHMNEAMHPQPAPGASGDRRPRRKDPLSRPVRLLKAYKIFNRDLERKFVTAGDSTETMRLYMGGDREWLRKVLELGRGESGVDPDTPIVLFEDPWHAAAKAANRDPSRPRQGNTIHALLQCRACPGTTLVLPGAARRLPDDDAIAKVAQRIPSGYTAACMSATGGNDEDDGSERDEDGACYVLRTSQAARVLPEFFMLVSEIGADDVVTKLGATGNAARGIDSNEAALEASLADLTKPLTDVAAGSGTGAAEAQATALLGGVDAEAAAVLASYQAKVSAEVERHERRVWREMDPETAKGLQRAENEVRRLTSHLNSLREQIDSEKGLQERILREFRQQVGRGSGSKASSGSRRGGY